MKKIFRFLAGDGRSTQSQPAGPQTLPVRLSLDERMALRRDALFETIRACMLEVGFVEGTYSSRISRTDRRGHRFVVMIDVTRPAKNRPPEGDAAWADIGRVIASNAKSHFSLLVDGVYWRFVDRLGAAELSGPDTDGDANAGEANTSAGELEALAGIRSRSRR